MQDLFLDLANCLTLNLPFFLSDQELQIP